MSLSKVQKLDDIKRRDSFGDRVCDDLSEVILQFLPIRQKFRFECVSKQFQRTVFKRHYELNVKYSKCRQNVCLKALKNNFETLIEKLSNIKSFKSDLILRNSDFDAIIKDCNHLIELSNDFSKIRPKSLKSLAKKFGTQLTSISINDLDPKFRSIDEQNDRDSFFDNKCKSIINSLVNIEEIEFNPVLRPKDLIEFYTEFKPKDLKKMSFNIKCLRYTSDVEKLAEIQPKYFKTFIDNNKSLTHLSIKIDGFRYGCSDEPTHLNLRHISQLSQLVSLRIWSDIIIDEDFEPFVSDLREIGVNCHKLKSLSLTLIEFSEEEKCIGIMSELMKFKGLKRLEIDISFKKDVFIKTLKSGFENLTHFTIDLSYSEMNDTFLQSIVEYLPNLRNLIIRTQFKETERTADIVSRLSKLETLELEINRPFHKDIINETFFNSFNKTVAKNCPKLRSIKFERHSTSERNGQYVTL